MHYGWWKFPTPWNNFNNFFLYILFLISTIKIKGGRKGVPLPNLFFFFFFFSQNLIYQPKVEMSDSTPHPSLKHLLFGVLCRCYCSTYLSNFHLFFLFFFLLHCQFWCFKAKWQNFFVFTCTHPHPQKLMGVGGVASFTEQIKFF